MNSYTVFFMPKREPLPLLKKISSALFLLHFYTSFLFFDIFVIFIKLITFIIFTRNNAYNIR